MMKFSDYVQTAKKRICEEIPDTEVTIRWISEPHDEARIDIYVQPENAEAVVSLDVSAAYRSYHFEYQNNYEYYKKNGTLENLADICLGTFIDEVKKTVSAMSKILKNDAKTVEKGAFANLHYIQTIPLSDSVELIGNKAFFCSTIKNIVFPAHLIEIGDSAFRGTKIESIELPSGVKCLQRGAFLECTQLKKASLPEGLEQIGHNAFQWCYELEEINIPSTVQTFGKVIFEDCKALKKLTCYENFVIETDTFGKALPAGLISSLETLENNMTAAAYQKYVLDDKVWSKLSRETQVGFFVKRNSKGLLSGYSKCIKADDIDGFGKLLLKKADTDKSTDLSRALYNFITLFHDLSKKEQILKMFAVLKNRKNTKKLIAELEQLDAIKDLFNEKPDSQTPEESDRSITSGELRYETIDSLADDYFADMRDLDIHSPIKAKLKKTMVTYNNMLFIVKFQSAQMLNRELSGLLEERYDPFYIINNKMYEELCEVVDCQPEERQYISVNKEADHIASDVLTKRIKFFAKTVDSLQSEDVLRTVIEMMPKKKNGMLFVKRTSVVAPVMIINSVFGLLVLCAKAVKDTEIEISLKYYSFRKMEEFHEFLKTANVALRLIMKG